MLVDYYKVLDLEYPASLEEIKESYKRLLDNPVSSSNTRIPIFLLEEAYQILSNPSYKNTYDSYSNLNGLPCSSTCSELFCTASDLLRSEEFAICAISKNTGEEEKDLLFKNSTERFFLPAYITESLPVVINSGDLILVNFYLYDTEVTLTKHPDVKFSIYQISKTTIITISDSSIDEDMLKPNYKIDVVTPYNDCLEINPTNSILDLKSRTITITGAGLLIKQPGSAGVSKSDLVIYIKK